MGHQCNNPSTRLEVHYMQIHLQPNIYHTPRSPNLLLFRLELEQHGQHILYKLKPKSIEKLHMSAGGGFSRIGKMAIKNTLINATEDLFTLTYEGVLPYLKEEYTEREIDVYNDYIIEQTEKALNIVGLLEYADEYPSIFGNPGLQKLGIARAIATGAKILIMDEPLGSLDPKVSKVFRHELRNLIKDLKLTAIHVTHNQEEAMAIADKIIIMRAGEILQMGSPYDLYEFPKSIFVANFLGETNFLQGFVLKLLEAAKMEVWIRLGGPKIICKNSNSQFNLDNNIVIAFRYEDVYLFPKDYSFEKSLYDAIEAGEYPCRK